MNVQITRPEPVVPPVTITIELSANQAQELRNDVGNISLSTLELFPALRALQAHLYSGLTEFFPENTAQ